MNSEAMSQYSADQLVEHEDTSRNKQYRGLSKPGMTNNPAGRPKGSRSKLSETFLQDVHQLWLEHGNQALRDMLNDSPTKFCQMVSVLLPKNVEISDGSRPLIELTNTELAAIMGTTIDAE